MNQGERNELSVISEQLGRIDERTANTYRLTEKQEQHLRDINGQIALQAALIATNTERSLSNAVWIGRFWKVIVALLACGGAASGITKGMGFW